MGVFEQVIQRALEARNRAVQAAQAAEQDRRRRREENDLYVTGGVHWNGYGLEPLIRMVAERASPAQLEALAGEWSRHGESVVRTSENLRRSVGTLMQFWSGPASDTALRQVTNNVTWISELGSTAQQMSGPIRDASGALRSAQDTMPGVPKNNWLSSAGGGAAAGFALGGPIGAAFGAALGGIASAFGFGTSKKKLKRKAVQTMQRYEGALLGIDQTTPQFGAPTDSVNPGEPPAVRPGPGIDRPPPAESPPGVGGGPVRPRPSQPLPAPVPNDFNFTDPSFAGTPEGRWQSLTGLGPNAIPGGGGGGTTGGGPLTGLGTFPPGGPRPNGIPGVPPRGGGPAGRGLGGTPVGRGGPGGGQAGRGLGGTPVGRGGPGTQAGRGGAGAPVGRGGAGRGGAAGAGARGLGAGAGARGAGGGGVPPGGASGGRGGDKDFRGRGRFGGAGALGPGGRGGGYGMGGAPGTRPEEEEDGEHRRRVPLEEDPFSTDLKAAPPVIGL